MKTFNIMKIVTISMVCTINYALADQGGSKFECKALCWGAEKAAQGIIDGINDVLTQKENKRGPYQKKHDYLTDRLRSTERNYSAMHLLEYDLVSKIPKFSAMIIRESIAKRTKADTCFHKCGSLRVADLKSIDFMYIYFMGVILALSMEDLKKAFLYRGGPFDTVNVQEMLDKVAKNIPENKLEALFAKAKDNKVIEYVKSVREGNNSFTALRPGE
jgi:hypothetical protein